MVELIVRLCSALLVMSLVGWQTLVDMSTRGSVSQADGNDCRVEFLDVERCLKREL